MNRLAVVAIADGCSHLLLQNPDASINEVEFEMMLHFSTVHPDTILSPTIITDKGDVWFEGGSLELEDGRAKHCLWRPQLDWLTGACLLIPAAVWTQLGGFSRGYFLYWEDVDLSFRWRLQGGRLAVLPVQAQHAVGATQQQTSGGKSSLYGRFNARNRLLFAGKNLGFRDLVRWGKSQRHYAIELMERLGATDARTRKKFRRAVARGSVEGALLGLATRLKRMGNSNAKRSNELRPAQIRPPWRWDPNTIRALNPKPRLFTYPYFADNPWQRMIYGQLDAQGIQLVKIHELPILPDHARLFPGDVLHINWTGPISQDTADTLEKAKGQVDATLRVIMDAKLHGVRVLWTVHNRMPHECPFPEAELDLLAGLVDLADAIMIMNPETPELVKPLYSLPTEKIWQLSHSSYLGHVPSRTEPFEARKRLGLPEDARVLLFYGELRPYKQLDLIIAAFKSISDPQLRLLIAGRPSKWLTAEELMDWCKGDPRIMLRLGRQSDEETADLFSAASLLIQAHRSGLNSGVVALAAGYGCPVVVSLDAETASLRKEAWIVGIDLRQSSTLSDAIHWATSRSDQIRAAALQWAELHRPEVVADEFSLGVKTISVTGEPPRRETS